jgi:DNA processing protein
MSGPDMAERIARAALARAAEPGCAPLAAAVRDLTGAEVWDRLRRDASLRGGRPMIEGRNGELELPPDVPSAVRSRVRERLATTDPERDLERGRRLGARFVVPGDEEWPTPLGGLRALDGEPYGLWLRGPLDLRLTSGRAVAIVGSRAASDYGLHVAGELGAQLVDRGWAVVSGGAYGIDGAAHRGALAAAGSTVAVLASGIDTLYPRGHDALLRRIGEEGLLLTEWPPGCAPQRHQFLTRNRVIAALTAGTVVVEAALRSGALSTASQAGKLNRQVMAVPGPVTSALSRGSHRLLRGGATLVTSAAEVVEQVGALGVDLSPEQRSPTTWRDALSETARRVLEAVPVRASAGPAGLAQVAGVDQLTVLRCLDALEGEGLVVVVDGGYRKTRLARSE